jgi:hypothetical protein
MRDAGSFAADLSSGLGEMAGTVALAVVKVAVALTVLDVVAGAVATPLDDGAGVGDTHSEADDRVCMHVHVNTCIPFEKTNAQKFRHVQHTISGSGVCSRVFSASESALNIGCT